MSEAPKNIPNEPSERMVDLGREDDFVPWAEWFARSSAARSQNDAHVTFAAADAARCSRCPIQMAAAAVAATTSATPLSMAAVAAGMFSGSARKTSHSW